MKRMLLTSAALGLVALLCVSLSGVASAGPVDDARIALRAVPNPGGFGACNATKSGVGTDCTEYAVDNMPIGGTYYVYVIVGQLAEAAGGVSFGIQYPSEILMGSWNKCSDGLDFANNNWPASGGGNRVTWTTCPPPAAQLVATSSGLQETFGYFYVANYGAGGVFECIPNPLSAGPDDDELAVGTCPPEPAQSFISILATGKVGFGPFSGYNPCGIIPAEETTWGSLKKQFSN